MAQVQPYVGRQFHFHVHPTTTVLSGVTQLRPRDAQRAFVLSFIPPLMLRRALKTRPGSCMRQCPRNEMSLLHNVPARRAAAANECTSTQKKYRATNFTRVLQLFRLVELLTSLGGA